eukprot:1382329-Pyramimonas_sp.AAC.1
MIWRARGRRLVLAGIRPERSRSDSQDAAARGPPKILEALRNHWSAAFHVQLASRLDVKRCPEQRYLACEMADLEVPSVVDFWAHSCARGAVLLAPTNPPAMLG